MHDSHTLPFYGTIDRESVMQAFAESGCEGNLNYESGAFVKHAPVALRQESATYMASIGKHLVERYLHYKNNLSPQGIRYAFSLIGGISVKPTLEYNLDLGGGALWQLANRSRTQMMSYIIDCPDGGTIVIDGGMYCDEDADHLYAQLAARGKRVDLWFFTHCHVDHYGAWMKLCERGNFDIEIGALCFHFPTRAWLLSKEDRERTAQFFSVLDSTDFRIVTPRYGDVYTCGGIQIEVLCEPIHYDSYRSINPTGIILKAHFPKRSVLFLGDYDVDAEKNFETHFSVEKLRCDIVQMAHHGQNGVSEEFYRKIAPKFCLYTAPTWLWENRKGSRGGPETVGEGPFATLETRLWMAKLRVVRSFHMGDGDWCFR